MAMIGELNLFVVIAGILLLASRKKGAAAYRWACVALILGMVDTSAVRMTVAVILLLASFGLRSNVVTEKGPAWMRKGAWVLVGLGFMAVNVFDQLLNLVQNFNLSTLVVMSQQVALILLLLAAEPQAPAKYAAKPRLKGVPAGESKQFSVAAVLLLAYVVFHFILNVVSFSGFVVIGGFSEALHGRFTEDPIAMLGRLLRLASDLIACGLLLSAAGRKKNFALAMFLLLINRIPGVDGAQKIGIVLAVMWVSALGVPWNKKLGGRIPATNLVSLVCAVVFLLSGVMSGISNCGETITNTKASIYREVVSEYESAAFKEAYDKRDKSEFCDGIEDETYEEFYQGMYDAAYKAAYDASYQVAYDRYYDYVSYMETPDLQYVKNNAERVAKNDAENVAENVAENFYYYLVDGMSYDVYDAVAENAALVGGGEIAAAEVYNNKAPEGGYPTFSGAEESKEPIYDTREAAREVVKYREKAKEEIVYENVIYAAGANAVDCDTILEAAFDKVYTAVYNEIYQPCVNAGTDAAYMVLENRKGDVFNNVLNVILPVICSALGLVALLLMNLCLTVEEAEKLPSGFKALLDWCYTNVGEKMQKCMKAMGAVYLVIGMISVAGGAAVAVVMFCRGELLFALAGAGVALAGSIVTAVNIIFTYPMFSFAQLTADIRHIRNNGGMAVAVKAPAKMESAAVEVVAEVAAEPAEAAESAEVAAPDSIDSVEETIAEMESAAAGEDDFDDLPDL